RAGPDSRPIKVERDVALIKLDGAGQVVATRVLGAASTASGFALAVDGDGKVAVAGSVTGALDEGRAGADAAAADSFVTVFDAAGEELWTQRRGARAADEATAVVFGPDGVVHVAGRARSAMPGGVALGGWDGYLQSFRPSQAHPLADVTVAATAVSQFGTAGDDKVAAVAISADSLYSAGVESGRLVIRRFTLDEAGRPTLAAQRDLGAAGGEVTGLAVRSEEHTSELQSRENLVCRLLLEKKKGKEQSGERHKHDEPIGDKVAIVRRPTPRTGLWRALPKQVAVTPAARELPRYCARDV